MNLLEHILLIIKMQCNPYKLENKILKDGRTVQATIKLDANGQAKVILASTKANDSAKPIVWIDQNWDNNSANQVLEDGEPVSDASKVKPTNFQPAYVNGAKLKEVDLTKDAREVRIPQFKGLLNTEDVKGFQFYFLNQSGTEYLPPATAWDKVDAQVTYEIVNTGAHPVKFTQLMCYQNYHYMMQLVQIISVKMVFKILQFKLKLAVV